MEIFFGIIFLISLFYLGLKVVFDTAAFLEKFDKLTRSPEMSRKLRTMLTGDDDQRWVKIGGIFLLIYAILGFGFLIFKLF